MKKRTDIQVLRGISVIAVIFFHLTSGYFPNGYLGVDIFFVISGLVITPIICSINLSNQRIALKNFYMKRFFRLVPALGCTLSVSAILIYLLGNIIDLKTFSYQGLHSILFVGNYGAQKYSENYFTSSLNPLIHTWSLAVEVQIYFLLPLALLCYLRMNKKPRKKNVQNIFIFLFFASLLTHLMTYSISEVFHVSDEIPTQRAFYLAFPRLWEFIAGSFLWFYSHSIKSILTKNLFRFSSVYLYSIALVLFLPVQIPKIIGIFTIVFFSFAFLLGTGDGGKNILLSWIGDRSYSIYLVHMPLIYLINSCFVYSNRSIRIIVILSTLISIFILGSLQYKFIEQKYYFNSRAEFNTGIKNFIPTLSRFIVIPILSFALILVSISFNFKPLLSKEVSDGLIATKLLEEAGCVDKNFDKLNCIWKSKDSKGLVLLVGDSQANSASEGIASAAKTLKLDFVGVSASGCPFLQVDSTGNKPIDCLPFQDSILKYIYEARPEFVFIANRASGYNNPHTNWRTYLSSSGFPEKTKKGALITYETHLESIAIELKRIGSTVLLFQDIPEVTNLVRPNSIFGSILQEARQIRVDEVRVKLDEDTRNIEFKLDKSGLIHVYDPSKYICNFHCNSIKNSTFYFDSWHLSKIGSLSLSKSLIDFISPLMKVDKPDI